MVDAEYTYLNPALGLFALAMMLVCNQPSQRPPLIFHTYQNYLKVGAHACWPYSQLSWPITLTKITWRSEASTRFQHLPELPEGRYTCRLALLTTVLAHNTKLPEGQRPPFIFHTYQNYLKVGIRADWPYWQLSSTLSRTTWRQVYMHASRRLLRMRTF